MRTSRWKIDLAPGADRSAAPPREWEGASIHCRFAQATLSPLRIVFEQNATRYSIDWRVVLSRFDSALGSPAQHGKLLMGLDGNDGEPHFHELGPAGRLAATG
jgi:hypothetical protein